MKNHLRRNLLIAYIISIKCIYLQVGGHYLSLPVQMKGL